jgi:hypothetical protein
MKTPTNELINLKEQLKLTTGQLDGYYLLQRDTLKVLQLTGLEMLQQLAQIKSLHGIQMVPLRRLLNQK